MKRISRLSTMLLIVAAGSVTAAEPKVAPNKPAEATAAALQSPDDNDRPVIDKWDIKFETSLEPARLAIDGDCSSFFEKQFVAEFDIAIPTSAYSTSYPLRNGYVFPADGTKRTPRRLASLALKKTVGGVPESRRPPKELVNAAIGSSVLRNSSRSTDDQHYPFTFEVFASSAERARELAETIISIYGEDYSVQLQHQSKAAIRSNREELARSREKVVKLKKDLANVDRQLDCLMEFADIKVESLVTFTEKLRALKVDMVETKGRVNASEMLIAQSDRNSSTSNQAAASKAQAEIQLAGEEAKRLEIERILTKGALRLELVDTQRALQEEIDGEHISGQEQCIASWVETRKDAEACPVPDSKAVIRPIKWEPPKAESRPAAARAPSGYPATYPPG